MTITETVFWVLLLSAGCSPELLSIQVAPTGPDAIRADDIRRDAWKLNALDIQGRKEWFRRRGAQHGLALSGNCLSSQRPELTLDIPSSMPPLETAMALAVSRAVPDIRLCIREYATLKCIENSPWLSTDPDIEISCDVDRPTIVEPLSHALQEWVKQR